MSKLPSHHEIAIASIPVFSDDGRLDLAELEKLLALALRDAIVDGSLAPGEQLRDAELATRLGVSRTPVREVVKDMEVGGVHRITTIHPRTYNEAKKIGESFREGTPVIMNLTDLDDADAKRLVDFAAGLVFGLQGAIERVTNKVFLLSPADVEVTTVDGAPAKSAKGLFNQS